MATDSDLTLPATVATELAGGVSAADPRLPRLIAVASQAIATYLGRRLHYGADINEKVKGYGRARIFVDVTPIVAITSITLGDGTVITDFVRENDNAGMIYRRACWPSTALSRGGLPPANEPAPGTEEPSITVVYNGGWVTPAQGGTRTLPYDIEEACIQTVVGLYRGGGREKNIASEQLGAYSVSFRTPNSMAGVGVGGIIPDEVLPLLAQYRRQIG